MMKEEKKEEEIINNENEKEKVISEEENNKNEISEEKEREKMMNENGIIIKKEEKISNENGIIKEKEEEIISNEKEIIKEEEIISNENRIIIKEENEIIIQEINNEEDENEMTNEEDTHDTPIEEEIKIEDLIYRIQWSHTRTEKDAIELISLIEKYNHINIYFLIRYLVYFPKILLRYINICTYISPDDYSCALSRCIEKNLSESVDILLNIYDKKELFINKYINDINIIKKLMSLKILIDKYGYNEDLYNKCRLKGIYDNCLEMKMKNIEFTSYPDFTSEDLEYKFGLYGGYRNTYHLCMYYPKGLICLKDKIKNESDFDCTAYAICDYFKIEKSDVINFIKKFF